MNFNIIHKSKRLIMAQNNLAKQESEKVKTIIKNLKAPKCRIMLRSELDILVFQYEWDELNNFKNKAKNILRMPDDQFYKTQELSEIKPIYTYSHYKLQLKIMDHEKLVTETENILTELKERFNEWVLKCPTIEITETVNKKDWKELKRFITQMRGISYKLQELN